MSEETKPDASTEIVAKTPVVPTVPSFNESRSKMLDGFKSLHAGKDEEIKPGIEEETKPDGEEETKPGEEETKPDGEEETKPGEEEEVSPDEQKSIDQWLADAAVEERVFHEVKAYTEIVTPETQRWLEEHRQARMQRNEFVKQAQAKAAEAIPAMVGDDADTDAEKIIAGATGDPSRDELVPVSLSKTYRSVKDLKSEWTEGFMSVDDLRQFEIDPNRVPAKYAKAFTHFMQEANIRQADANYFRKEAKGAFEKRDTANMSLFKREFEDHLRTSGFVVDDSVSAILPEIRKASYLNGARQPFEAVMKVLTQKYPNIIRKTESAGGTVNAGTGHDNTGNLEKAKAAVDASKSSTPAAPQGGRASTDKNKPDLSKAVVPTTASGARQHFSEQFKKMHESRQV